MTNRLSFGLLDRPETKNDIPAPQQQLVTPPEVPATE